jgi:hypothetical protein
MNIVCILKQNPEKSSSVFLQELESLNSNLDFHFRSQDTF